MAAVFACLRRWCAPKTAYNIGFAVYWGGWCLAVPVAVLGPRAAVRLLTGGRRPSIPEMAILAVPLAGAIGTELMPNRDRVDRTTAAVMVGSGLINAVGEELLWRGLFMRSPDRADKDGVPLEAIWSLLGFAVWHLAPQLILPSSLGPGRFVAGSALVGGVSTIVALQSDGLRYVAVAHILTDACGVTAARFRLGKEPVPT